MPRLQRFVSLLGLAAAFALVAPAAELEGILMDKMCSGKVASDGVEAARTHTRDCALMEPCIQSGFVVVTSDAKVVALDETGNKKAVEALKATSKKDNLRVKVTGEQSGDTFQVASLKLL